MNVRTVMRDGALGLRYLHGPCYGWFMGRIPRQKAPPAHPPHNPVKVAHKKVQQVSVLISESVFS
jgi:hypothetical protein